METTESDVGYPEEQPERSEIRRRPYLRPAFASWPGLDGNMKLVTQPVRGTLRLVCERFHSCHPLLTTVL